MGKREAKPKRKRAKLPPPDLPAADWLNGKNAPCVDCGTRWGNMIHISYGKMRCSQCAGYPEVQPLVFRRGT